MESMDIEVRTIKDVFKSQSPALSGLVKELSPSAVEKVIALYIIDLNEFFNVNRGMSAPQVIWTAKRILQEYWRLKPEDLKLFFDNAKMGRYGKVYDRLDGAMIFGWLDEYVVQRDVAAENDSIDNHISNLPQRVPTSVGRTKIAELYEKYSKETD